MTGYRSRRLQEIEARAAARPRLLPAAPPAPPADVSKVQPWRITVALDRAGLYDPELSHTLGVSIGTVDRWEEGADLPTVVQLIQLAQLTGHQVGWFLHPQPPVVLDGPIFLCGPGGGLVEPDEYELVDQHRWKIVRDRPDALLPPELPLESPT